MRFFRSLTPVVLVCMVAVSQTASVAGGAPGGTSELIRNGSFERELPGLRPMVPFYWVQGRETEGDRFEVIDDCRQAHWGRRCLLLSGRGKRGIVVNTFGYSTQMQPGKSYVVRVWVRAQGDRGGTLFVEPGHGKIEATGNWREWRLTFVYPADAPAALPLSLRVLGGPVLIDDVSLALAGTEPETSPELKADRGELREVPFDRKWRRSSGEPAWRERVAVRVSEVMGRAAKDYTIELPLQEVFPGIRFDYISRKSIKVVDPSVGGGKAVRFGFLKTRAENIRALTRTGWDRLAIIVDCPARSTKTYYVYVAGRGTDKVKVNWPTALPKTWPKTNYPYQLDCQVGVPEKPIEVTVTVKAGQPVVAVRNWRGGSAAAKAVSPDGKQELVIPLTAAKDDRYLWVSRDFKLPAGGPEGVWGVAVQVSGEDAGSEEVEGAFVHGSTLWWASSLTKVFRRDPPVYGRRRIELSAARNEREAFQVVVASSTGLRGVTLAVTDLVQEGGEGKIPGSRIRFERVEEIYLFYPMVNPIRYLSGFGAFAYSGRGGWHPDPLLPWGKQDIAAGGQKVAWGTLSVPKGVPAGRYTGHVVAIADNGVELRMPITLTVFDFSLPDRLTFTPVLGADVGGDADRAMSTAELFGRRGCSPFYYKQWYSSPYPSPWRYDPKTKKAKMDFSTFDKNVRYLLEEVGVKYLFLASAYHPGAKKFGNIYDGGKELKTEHRASNDTPEATDMWRAWSEAMGAHLMEKGWIENAYVYLADEPAPQLLGVIEKIGRILKARYPIRAFVACSGSAGDAIGGWKSYLDWVDAYSGRASLENRKRMEAKGIAYWGVYNRPWWVGVPLATQRLIGLDSWVDNVPVYFHWSLANLRRSDWRVEPRRVKWYGPVAGAPAGTFLRRYSCCGKGNAVYFWPDGEPVPEGMKKPVGSSIRLESLREGIEDYEYMEILKGLASKSVRDSWTRRAYQDLRKRLRELVEDARIDASWTHVSPAWCYFVIDPGELEGFRRDLAKAIEQASK